MMNRRATLALILLVAIGSSPARAADPGAMATARRALQAAVNHADPAALMQARARFQALSSAEPRSAALHDWVAVATWRTVPLLHDRVQAERLCQDGLDHCEAALLLERRSGLTHAIKGALLGLMIGYRPGEMMSLGMAMGQEFGQALGADPKDPRIWLLDGINTLYKPESFGGGPAVAREQLQKAAALFAATPPADSTAADWGHDDTLLWLGRAVLAQKDSAAAESLYARALEVNPDNGWVKNSLLPQLRKARGGTGRP